MRATASVPGRADFVRRRAIAPPQLSQQPAFPNPAIPPLPARLAGARLATLPRSDLSQRLSNRAGGLRQSGNRECEAPAELSLLPSFRAAALLELDVRIKTR